MHAKLQLIMISLELVLALNCAEYLKYNDYIKRYPLGISG